MKSIPMRTQVMILICGSLIVLLSFGLRQNFGLYMDPISSSLGWGREVWGDEGAEGLGRGGIYHSIHGTILYNMVPYHTI